MSESDDKKGFIIFGRDITNIPCFRNSFLYGIYGGITCGLIRFMFTSRPKSSADFAMTGFTLITLTYWIQCRYQYSKTKFEMDRLKNLLQQRTLYEGTEKEKELIKDETENVLVDA